MAGPVEVLRNQDPAELWVTFWVTAAGSSDTLAVVGRRPRFGLSKSISSRALARARREGSSKVVGPKFASAGHSLIPPCAWPSAPGLEVLHPPRDAPCPGLVEEHHGATLSRAGTVPARMLASTPHTASDAAMSADSMQPFAVRNANSARRAWAPSPTQW